MERGRLDERGREGIESKATKMGSEAVEVGAATGCAWSLQYAASPD
jgi:hypothetical protein